ncbi:NAD(P)H-dependent oxidoreductase [Alteraurantiacibacter buctensis]|uniref:Flavodoxin family protein n=1 Tax=Alteraurantiacibacter buctensis TaxID=1503981 RepID=A0A844Z165_9SPHN|nr:NAD(P)H-dependent oxidoreductase [Alteraurantiacibacter buctensis]MXO72721.1 flavodoxin family protein [Alteraurantiacibacter buctensis]
MSGTLILKFHPGYQPSKLNLAMTEAVSGMAGVDVVDMYALYPHEDDLKAAEEFEVGRLCRAERLCVQFPVHWFASTPRAMAWQDLVLNRMFFLRPDEGKALRGLPLMISATAGQGRETYRPGGENLYPLEELLRPWECTANQGHFAWHPPFLAYGADDLDDTGRAEVARHFARHIAQFAAATRS